MGCQAGLAGVATTLPLKISGEPMQKSLPHRKWVRVATTERFDAIDISRRRSGRSVHTLVESFTFG